MSTYRTEGIILRRTNFGEANLLVHIFTKDHGKIEAVGKSARKAKGKLKGHLEPFLYADFNLVRGKKLDTVAGSFVLDPMLGLRSSFDAVLSASAVAEIADRMTVENYRDESVFELLRESLRFLDGAAGGDRMILWLLVLFFEVNLLIQSGFAPQSDKCVFCGEKMPPGRNYFSFSLGGALDSQCSARIPDAVRVSDEAIKLLRFLSLSGTDARRYEETLHGKLQELPKLNVSKEAVFRATLLMKDFIEFNIDRKINSLQAMISFARGGN